MTRDESESQQEIVLGNKQLLSVFFVVVALLGVAFTIGYIIGRNTGSLNAVKSSQGDTPAANTRASSNPVPVQEPPVVQPATSGKSLVDTPEPLTPAVTKPAKPYEPNASGTNPAKVPPAADELPQTTGENRYLQVAALKKVDAEHIVQMLRDRKFTAALGESPKEGYVRVLVGPFTDMTTLADAKQRLRAAGFDPIVAR